MRHERRAYEARELPRRRQAELRHRRRRRRHRRAAAHQWQDREPARGACRQRARRHRAPHRRSASRSRHAAGTAAGDSRSATHCLRRRQLPRPRRRDRPRHLAGAERVPAAHRYAARSRPAAGAPERLRAVRLRRRACRRDRPAGTSYRRGGRARPRRRIHLLRRRQRARLSEVLGHLRQEFSRDRSARSGAGDDATRSATRRN